MIRSSLLRLGVLLACGLGLLILPSSVRAQESGADFRFGGIGGGTAALFTNPAMLSVGSRPHPFELSLGTVRTRIGGSLLQFDHYTDTFTGQRRLSSSEIQTTLDDWFGGEMRTVEAQLDVVPVALTYRSPDAPWAVGGAIRVRTAWTSSVNRGLFDVLLRGTGANRTVPIDGRYRTFSTVDLTGAWSYRFSDLGLSVGVAPRLILGTGFADGTLDSVVEVTDDAVTHRFDYTARAAGFPSTEIYDVLTVFDDAPLSGAAVDPSFSVSGLGAGVDLGATYRARSGLLFSVSLTDLGVIQWNHDAQIVTPANETLRFEGFAVNLDRVDEAFDGDVRAFAEHKLDSLARGTYEDVERTRERFGTGLPTALHVGTAWQPTGSPVTLRAGVSAGLREEAGAVTSTPGVHVGGHIQIGPVPIRAEVRVLGDRAATLAFGTGLRLSGYRFAVGARVTPQSTFLGDGARYGLGFSLATVRW